MKAQILFGHVVRSGGGTVTKGKARRWTEEGGWRGGLGRAAGRSENLAHFQTMKTPVWPHVHTPQGALGPFPGHHICLVCLSTPGLPADPDSTQGPSTSSSPWPWWPGRKLQRPGPPGSLSITPLISKRLTTYNSESMTKIQYSHSEIHQTSVKPCNVPRGQVRCSFVQGTCVSLLNPHSEL